MAVIPRSDRAGSSLASVSLRVLALVAACWSVPALGSLPSLDDARMPALELPSPPTALERLEQREQEREACGVFCAAEEPKKRTQDAWGNYRFPAELEASQNRFGFTGHYWDTETQLYYAKARYFSPEFGRFISQDSYLGQIDSPPSLHRYAYVSNRPTRMVDPTGRSEEDVHHHLTRFLAEAVGFSGDKAKEIGAATGMLDYDQRDAMAGGINKTNMNVYHFVSPEQLTFLRERAFNSNPDAFNKKSRFIGEYFHALEDTYTHQSDPEKRDFGAMYKDASVLNLGHGLRGHWPDQTWQRPDLAMQMAEDVYGELRRLYKRINGTEPPRGQFDDIRERVREFVEYKPKDEVPGDELYPQRKFRQDVLDVRSYAEKLKILGAGYTPTDYETKAREDDYGAFVDRERNETIIEPDPEMRHPHRSYRMRSPEEIRKIRRDKVEELEEVDSQFLRQDEMERARREKERRR